MGSLYVAQAGLELLSATYSTTLISQSAGITGVSYHIQPKTHLFFSFSADLPSFQVIGTWRPTLFHMHVSEPVSARPEVCGTPDTEQIGGDETGDAWEVDSGRG